MMRYLIFLLVFFSSLALAQTEMNNGMTWTPPTEYTDGTPIASGDIENYTILCGLSSDDLALTTTVSGTTTFAGRDLFINTLGLSLGTEYVCGVRVTTKNGLVSALSTTVNFTLPDQRTPNAPTNLVVD